MFPLSWTITALERADFPCSFEVRGELQLAQHDVCYASSKYKSHDIYC
jgi:hypothetical protein